MGPMNRVNLSDAETGIFRDNCVNTMVAYALALSCQAISNHGIDCAGSKGPSLV